MKKLIAKFLVILIILQIISPISLIGQVFAVSNSWDLSIPADYTVSDSAKINLHNSEAKLKSTLSSVWRLNNWPTLFEQATQVEVSWNYAYVTAYGSNAIEIIDISDSANPVHVSSITMTNSVKLYWAYWLKISGNYLYVASYSDDDIEIINISDPVNPVHVTNIANKASRKLNWPRWLDIVGNYLYVASYVDDALQIIDITIPTAPVSKWFLKDVKLNWAMSVKVSGNYAYVVNYYADSMQVIDISDPDVPVFAGELLDNTWWSRLNWAWWIDIKWDYAYIASYLDDTLEIVDISTPTDPVHLAHVRNTVAWTKLNWPRQLRIDGNFVYVSSFVDDAVQIIQISDPASPIVKWYLQDTIRLNWASWIYINWNDAFVTSSDWWSLQVLNISNENSPSFKWETLGWPVKLWWATNIITDWNYAYISSYLSHSIEIVDITDKTNPIHKSVISATNTVRLKWVYDLQKVWNYLYTANHVDDAMTIIDVSDPNNPFQASTIIRATNTSTNKLNWARWIYVEWNYAYIASYVDDALQIIDISDPLNPIIKWFIRDTTKLDWAVDVKVKWNYAYVSSYAKDRIQVIDISDKNNPIFVNELLNSESIEWNWTWWLEIEWNYLYVSALVDDGMQVYDITDWANPTPVSKITNSTPVKLNWARNSVLSEWYSYIASAYDDSVQILDISDTTSISPINYYRDNLNMNWINWISKQWNYIFTANYHQNSLEILKENYFYDSPFIVPNNSFEYTWEITWISETLWSFNTWNITYQISKDDWGTWYYYNWTSWNSTTSWTVNSNSTTVINSNISGFNSLAWWTNKFKFKAFLNSNWNQKVELSEVIVDFSDLTAPIISSTNITNNQILPGWNHLIEYNYSDEVWWSWIDISTASIVLEKYNWTSWVLNENISNNSTTTLKSIYNTSNLDFWKYRITFNISDNAWNISTNLERIFYIDKPELIISTDEVNIWELNDLSNTFWNTITVTVKTIWAPFNVKLKKNNSLTQVNSWDIIPYYDWTIWMWYDKNNDSNLSDYNDDIIMQEVENINTSWDLNTYTYTLKIWAIINPQQASWDYSWKIDFGIELNY